MYLWSPLKTFTLSAWNDSEIRVTSFYHIRNVHFSTKKPTHFPVRNSIAHHEFEIRCGALFLHFLSISLGGSSREFKCGRKVHLGGVSPGICEPRNGCLHVPEKIKTGHWRIHLLRHLQICRRCIRRDGARPLYNYVSCLLVEWQKILNCWLVTKMFLVLLSAKLIDCESETVACKFVDLVQFLIRL